MSRGARPVLACVVLVAGFGAVHGVATDRWGPSDRLTRAVDPLDRVPPVFGDWAGQDVEYEPEDMARAGIRGCVYRAYRNTRTREVVSVLLVCGRGGPICVHSPEVCYAGGGFRQLGPAKPVEVEAPDGTRHVFQTTRFGRPEAVSPRHLEVYWGWSVDGRAWVAPENPRLTLARRPAVYKLYVVREYVPASRGAEKPSTVCQDFLRRALPEVGSVLAGGAS